MEGEGKPFVLASSSFISYPGDKVWHSLSPSV